MSPEHLMFFCLLAWHIVASCHIAFGSRRVMLFRRGLVLYMVLQPRTYIYSYIMPAVMAIAISSCHAVPIWSARRDCFCQQLHGVLWVCGRKEKGERQLWAIERGKIKGMFASRVYKTLHAAKTALATIDCQSVGIARSIYTMGIIDGIYSSSL